MRDSLNRTINIDAGILSTVVLVGGYRAAEASDGDDPRIVKLTGLVRDFHERTHENGHTDFEKRPDHGFGHYAGNVGLFLGEDGKPVFTGQGRKLSQQAQDASGRPIAPHLANSRFSDDAPAAADAPESCATLQDSRDRDAYEVCLVDVVNNADGTSSWTYNVREIRGKDLSHWNLKLDDDHQVMPGTTAGYDFGLDGSTGFYGIKWDVADSFSQGDFTIVLDGHYDGAFDDEGVLAKGGRRASEPKPMYVPTMSAAAGSGPGLVADADLNDQAASDSYSDTGAIESSESFDQWYNDVLGVNISRPLTIDLVQQEDGSFVFDDKTDPVYVDLNGFFPIDGALFGNPGGNPDHNFHFTFELHTEFTYDADGDQIFKFIGDDDVWVYIDGKLAIDLGGVHAATEQYVDLDRLGLEDGESYTLDFFFAERHRTQSNFRIETNLDLVSTVQTPSMTAAFD